MTGASWRGGRMPCAMTFCLGTHGRNRPLPSGAAAAPDPAVALVLALLFVSLLFVLAPGIDLWASALFAGSRGGFPLSLDPWLLALRDLNRALPAWIVAGLLAALLARGCSTGPLARRLPRPSFVLLVLGTYLAGPLGIVHALKNTVGRARPQDVVAFGGEDVFTAAWQISDACLRNCSFSSGEAASAAVMPLLAGLAPRRWRPAAFVALALPAAAFSFNRVAFGSHFLSDVLVSWLLVALAAAMLSRLVAARAERIDAALDGRLRAAASRRLARLGQPSRSSFAPGALLRAPDGAFGAMLPHGTVGAQRSGARSSSIREHSEAWLFRATSRRWFSPIPAASIPRSS